MKMRKHRPPGLPCRLTALMLAGILSTGLLPFPLGAVENSESPINLTLPAAPAVPENDIRRDATVRAIEVAMPSVVNIATAAVKRYADYDPFFQAFYGPVHQREELYSIGSGIIIDEDGYVLTNLHVLQNATRAQVKLSNGMVYDVESTLVASPNSDLALIKLQKKFPDEKFKPIKFGRDDDLLLGETVIAIGNPFGLGGSVSRGILSSKNRRATVDDAPLSFPDWLQTDAAINAGNSGGPLINLHGELIGVNNANGNGRGIGFAIPVKQIQISLSELLAPELTDKLWFGARVRSENGNLIINSVQTHSPAEAAGLRVGQQILEVNGKMPDNLGELNRLLVENPNQNVPIVAREAGRLISAEVKMVPFTRLIHDKIGVSFGKVTPEMAANFGADINSTGVIDDVEKGGPAEKAQLRTGLIIAGIDGHKSGDLFTVGNILSTKTSGDNVQLTVAVPRKYGNNAVEIQQGTVNVRVR